MNGEQAKSRAHEYLCRRIEITPSPKVPDNVNLYDFKPAEETLFTFHLFGHDMIGATEYIAVDRETWEFRYLGFHGE